MKKIYALGAVAMALLTTGCSNDLTNNDSGIDNTGKERILFSAGDDGQSSVVTRAGFTVQTRIVARIVSDKRGGGDAKCVKTVLSAVAEANSSGYSVVSYNEGKTRYWDDAYGRSSILSVYAVAVPNVNDASETSNLKESVLKGGDTWSTTDASSNSITWTVKSTQVYADLAAQDLTYSNNIQQTGDKGVVYWDYTNKGYIPAWKDDNINATKHTYGTDPVVNDGRLYFTQQGKNINEALTEDPGHFDRGHMDFKHSLTRIQVNLIKGDGYGDAPFEVTDMQLLGQSLSGTFNIKTAAWSDKGTATAVKMAKWATAATRTDSKTNAATYEAQVLPGYTFENNATNVLQITVDNNPYNITNEMLRTALNGKVGDNYETQIGIRYVFDVTVTKSEIKNITATIVDWNEVTAENTTLDNSHVKFTFYNNGSACNDINLYKYEQTLDKVYTDNTYTAAPVAGSVYAEVAGLTKDSETNTYKTSEYYKDNKTAYHFRSINNVAEEALNDGKTAFTMTSGDKDYHWGAPMTSGISALPYNGENGYLASIAKGIVAADKESQINLTEIHMMSQLVIKLTTPATGGVSLVGATVKLTKLSKTGTVDMGSGKVTPATGTGIGDLDAVTVAKEGDTDVYSCTINVVPQNLTRGSGDDDYVGITIKTTDNNEYYIIKKLKEIKASSVGSAVTNVQTANTEIETWFPGHKYIYTFNIKKKEIETITATIVPWNEVVAGNTDLDLEK